MDSQAALTSCRRLDEVMGLGEPHISTGSRLQRDYESHDVTERGGQGLPPVQPVDIVRP